MVGTASLLQATLVSIYKGRKDRSYLCNTSWFRFFLTFLDKNTRDTKQFPFVNNIYNFNNIYNYDKPQHLQLQQTQTFITQLKTSWFSATVPVDSPRQDFLSIWRMYPFLQEQTAPPSSWRQLWAHPPLLIAQLSTGSSSTPTESGVHLITNWYNNILYTNFNSQQLHFAINPW